MITWANRQQLKSKILNQAFYFVADANNRVIEEFGFDVGSKDKYTFGETLQILNSVEFAKDKASEDATNKSKIR